VNVQEHSQPASVSQEDASGLYDGIAKYYDKWASLTETRPRRLALKLAAIKDGQHVMEVAAGTGLAFLEVVRSNPHGRNVGIDLSPGMLARAKDRLDAAGCTNFELSTGTALDIQQPPESFDVLLNSYMFDLIDNEVWPKILAEFRRVLKPGGRLVLTNMTLGERFGSGVYERVYQRSPRLLGGCRGVRLVEPLREAGFEVKSRRYVQQFLFPSEVISARKSEIAVAGPV
jgi:ubiquinone/menaquinone biosynthesis C-methylase UbiE